MKIQVLSDLHLEFEPYDWQDAGADVVVLAGDIDLGLSGIRWALDTITKPVIYVLGNHEFYHHEFPDLIAVARNFCRGTHVHVLESDAVTIEGVEFIGATFWTDFKLYGDQSAAMLAAKNTMADYRVIKQSGGREFAPEATSDLHQFTLDWLRDLPDTNLPRVVVSHHAPSEQSVPAQYKNHELTPAFATDLSDIVTQIKPSLWIHGHMHESADYRLNDTRVVCNPRGYPQELGPTFDDLFTVNI